MSKKWASRRAMRSLCGEVGPGDGFDPRLESNGGGSRYAGRKIGQLCAQAAEALSYALAASADDEFLGGLIVVSVVPGPDSARLIVTVAPPVGDWPDPVEMMSSLDRASGRLRAEVARSITRSKAPTLSFRIVLARGTGSSRSSLGGHKLDDDHRVDIEAGNHDG